MKKLLFAMDYTDHSLVALKYASDLSIKLQATLIVLHVFDIPAFSGTTMIRSLKQTQKRAYKEQRSILETYCKKHLESSENVQLEVLKHMSVIDGILEMTTKLSVDLVIVGIKDEHSKRGIFASDIGKALITKSPCPLLVIPDNSNAMLMKNIVYATDFEEDDIDAIRELVVIASSFEATIHVIHISTSKKDNDDEQMAWFKEMLLQKVGYPGIEFDILHSENIYRKLQEFVKSIDADLIVLLERRERGMFKKLFHKDLVKLLETHTSVPLLSFNAKTQKI